MLPILAPTSCDDCGHCCQGIGSPVVLYADHGIEPHPFRPAGLPQELIDEINREFAGLHRGQEPQDRCLWYDANSRRCRHYRWRPAICHEYELGGTACLIERSRAGI